MLWVVLGVVLVVGWMATSIVLRRRALLRVLRNPDSYVEFEVTDPPRLPALEALVAALGEANGNEALTLDAKHFAHLLDPGARLWFERSPEDGGYPFDALVENLGYCEYTLAGVRRMDARLARIYIEPWSGPFGGVEELKALAEAFGQRVTRDWGV